MHCTKAIVILNYNGLQHLQTYLGSVVDCSPNWKIIIVDNASSDTSVSYIKDNFAQIEVIALERNFGFSEGYNRALAQIQGKYELYFILNSDVRLTPNWDTPLLDFLGLHEDVAAVQPKVLSDKNQNKFEHAGAAGGYLDLFYYPFCRGRIFDDIEIDALQYDSPQEVSWVSGAAMLIRANCFEQAGGFDNTFFAHMEEIDLCLRLAKQGKKLYCIGASRVYHLGGGTLQYDNPKKVYLNFRNSLWMIVKNHGRYLLPLLFVRMLLDGLAALVFLIKGKPKLTWQIFLAHMSLYSHFKKFYKMRTKTNVKLYRYSSLIIWDYYIKGIKQFSALNKRKFS